MDVRRAHGAVHVPASRHRRPPLSHADRRRPHRAAASMTLDLARTCIARGIEEARRLGFKVAIAVVDAAGHLMACERMDGALWVTPEIARAKANAAAGFQASTLDLEERFTKRMLFADNVATLRGYEFVFGKGGMPVMEG